MPQPGCSARVWRSGQEDLDTKEVRDTATLSRVSEIGARKVLEAVLATQMMATHAAAMACYHWAALAAQTFAGRELV